MKRENAAQPLTLLVVTAILLGISAIRPHDYFTWLLEVFPALLAAAILWATYGRMRLTNLVYRLVAMHAAVLILGAHYTYAEVPLGFWIQDLGGFSRNHYDRIGHFFQGFVPALVAREILLRASPLRPGKWLFFLVVCVCLAFSAVYEFVEWWVAVLSGEAADSFLGTQGDVWDTQTDMFLCMCGAVLSQLLLGRAHDRALGRLLPGQGDHGIEASG